jgi:uncharacterized membrane protein HdeD (DUF308 family)
MLDHWTRNWWLLALRGALAILFALVAFLLPLSTVAALMMLFGAFMLIDGIFALVAAWRFRDERERWGALLFEGVVGVLIGAIALFLPGVVAISLIFLAAAWAIVTGVLQIITAIRLRKEIQDEWLLGLGGALSVLLGVLLFLFPAAGVVAWAWMLGGYALLAGIILLGLAFRLRGMHGPTHLRPQASA